LKSLIFGTPPTTLFRLSTLTPVTLTNQSIPSHLVSLPSTSFLAKFPNKSAKMIANLQAAGSLPIRLNRISNGSLFKYEEFSEPRMQSRLYDRRPPKSLKTNRLRHWKTLMWLLTRMCLPRLSMSMHKTVFLVHLEHVAFLRRPPQTNMQFRTPLE
jgi:hypothetical protein